MKFSLRDAMRRRSIARKNGFAHAAFASGECGVLCSTWEDAVCFARSAERRATRRGRTINPVIQKAGSGWLVAREQEAEA